MSPRKSDIVKIISWVSDKSKCAMNTNMAEGIRLDEAEVFIDMIYSCEIFDLGFPNILADSLSEPTLQYWLR